MDNAKCHPTDLNLSNVQVAFFPTNTSSVCQPMDLGVIRNYKELYKKKFFRHIVALINKEVKEKIKVEKNVSVLDVILWTISFIKSIKPKTVRKCFIHPGFSTDSEIDTEEKYEENSENNEEIQILVKTICPDMSAEDYLTLEDGVETSNNTTDVRAIIANRISPVETDDDSSDDEDKENVSQENQPCP